LDLSRSVSDLMVQEGELSASIVAKPWLPNRRRLSKRHLEGSPIPEIRHEPVVSQELGSTHHLVCRVS
jgi:hypothetical protein